MLNAMQADTSALYYIDVGPLPVSVGGGTFRILQPEPSLWDKILGSPLPRPTVVMTVDPSGDKWGQTRLLMYRSGVSPGSRLPSG
jgi:hypothetical protein